MSVHFLSNIYPINFTRDTEINRPFSSFSCVASSLAANDLDRAIKYGNA